MNKGLQDRTARAEQSWRLLTAALLVVTLFAQSLLPFFYAAEARASQIEGRNVLIDGFGLIAFASIFPIVTVMSYAILMDWVAKPGGKGT